MPKILLLNGPNLNLLGSREPGVYGEETLKAIESRLGAAAEAAGCELEAYQSNAEHELIEKIQAAPGNGADALIFNPGGYTHSSVALRDALLAVGLPFIEVHLSNINAREEFRRHSYFSDIALGVISGLGALGYELALQALAQRFKQTSE